MWMPCVALTIFCVLKLVEGHGTKLDRPLCKEQPTYPSTFRSNVNYAVVSESQVQNQGPHNIVQPKQQLQHNQGWSRLRDDSEEKYSRSTQTSPTSECDQIYGKNCPGSEDQGRNLSPASLSDYYPSPPVYEDRKTKKNSAKPNPELEFGLPINFEGADDQRFVGLMHPGQEAVSTPTPRDEAAEIFNNRHSTSSISPEGYGVTGSSGTNNSRFMISEFNDTPFDENNVTSTNSPRTSTSPVGEGVTHATDVDLKHNSDKHDSDNTDAVGNSAKFDKDSSLSIHAPALQYPNPESNDDNRQRPPIMANEGWSSSGDHNAPTENIPQATSLFGSDQYSTNGRTDSDYDNYNKNPGHSNLDTGDKMASAERYAESPGERPGLVESDKAYPEEQHSGDGLASSSLRTSVTQGDIDHTGYGGWTSNEYDMEFASEVLDAHNYYRARHRAGPLVLDEKLNKLAQDIASEFASGAPFNSNDTKLGKHGETIAVHNGSPSGSDAVNIWYKEYANYDFVSPKLTSSPSPNANDKFTAIVWNASRKLGVGKARTHDGRIFVVTTYFPKGNDPTTLRGNVFAPLPRSRASY